MSNSVCLPTPILLRRLSLLLTVVLMSTCWPCLLLAEETPGETLHSFSTPGGYSKDKSRWGFNETLGRHYFTNVNQILVTDRDGTPLKTWDISESENRDAFNTAHGNGDHGAFFFIGESKFYLLASNQTTMTVWNFVDLYDGTADVFFSRTIDFSLVLPNAGASGIDRALDGSWWIISDSSIYHLNSLGSGILRSITPEELGNKLVGSGSSTLRPELIAVDQVSGDLYLYISGGTESSYMANRFYRIDQQSLLQKGRFYMGFSGSIAPAYTSTSRIIGATDGFALLRYYAPPMLELSLEPQDLPDLTSFSFDQEGVIWTYCYSNYREVTATLGVNWGMDAGPDRVIDPAPVSIGSAVTSIDANSAVLTFPRSNLIDLPPFFEDLILLLNDKGQISTPIPITLPVASYNGPVMFAPTCPAFSSFDEVIKNKKVTWTWNGVAPKEPFNGWVEFEDYVPWVGGKRYGIKDIQATGKAEISSKDDGSVSVAGGGAFLLGPGKLRTEFGGGVVQVLKPEGPEVTGGLLSMKVEGSVSQEAGLIEVFPQLAPLKAMAFIGSAMKWLDQRAKLTATITLGMDSSTKVTLSEEDDILFTGQITGYLGLAVAAAVNLINGYAEVNAYGEGKGSVTLIPSSEGLAVDNIEITALIGAKIRAYLLQRSVQKVISISSKDGVVVSRKLPNGGLVSDTGWQYAYTEETEQTVKSLPTMPYVLTPNPFKEMDRRYITTKYGKTKRPVDSEIRVLAGIPASATLNAVSSPNTNKMMVVWTQPIPGNPSTQATDVWYSYFDGNSYSTPAPIYTDTRADFNPKVAYHGFYRFEQEDAVWIAVWERNGLEAMTPTGDPEADTETIIANLRPCWSWFDPTTRQWTEPEDLPINGANGFNVQVMNSGTGNRAGIAWLESDTGSMYPWDLNATDPSQGRIGGIRLRYMQLFYRSDLNDLLLVENVKTLGEEDPDNDIRDDIVEYSVGIDQRIGGATEVIILITRLMDVQSIDPFTPTMRIESWGSPGFAFVDGLAMKLKSFEDDVPVASNPQVQVKGNIRTTAIISDSTFLLGKHQQGGGTPPLPDYTILPSYDPVEFEPDDPFRPQGAEFQSYSLVDLPEPVNFHNNPPRAVIFQKPDASGNLKLHMAGPTRKMGPITYGSDTDRHSSVILSHDGTLLTMYHQVPLIKTPTTTAKLLGTEEEDPLVDIQEEELGFFTLSRRLIVTNLLAGETTLRSGFFTEGSTVTLETEIKNSGDNPVEAPRFSLYAYPANDIKSTELIPIVENELAVDYIFQSLIGNDTIVKSIDWVVPDDRDYSFLLVVDPEDEVEEYDEDDNANEDTINNGLPSELIEWLLGRYAGDPSGFDANEDGFIDAGDI